MNIPLGQPNQLLVLSRIADLELWKRALLGVTVLQLKFYYASLWAEGSTTNLSFKLQCHSLLKDLTEGAKPSKSRGFSTFNKLVIGYGPWKRFNIQCCPLCMRPGFGVCWEWWVWRTSIRKKHGMEKFRNFSVYKNYKIRTFSRIG